MSKFVGFDILSSGMQAQRIRMNIITSNLANARTTRTEAGGPYRRLEPVFQSLPQGDDAFADDFQSAMRGVKVVGVAEDQTPFQRMYDPGHPDAAADGYVDLPNVNVVEEMVNLVTASRSFEATTQAFQTVRSTMLRAMDIGR